LKKQRKTLVLLLLVLFLVIFVQNARANDLIIVVSQSTQQGSQKWFDFLNVNDVPIKIIAPDEFEIHKLEKYIVIMGSMDEGEDVKNLLKQALTSEEMNLVSQKGNGNMYSKPDKWSEGQNVIVFAGSSQRITEAVRKANREEWFEKFTDWFDIETAGGFKEY
jgi:hypothetical protein